MLTFIVNKIILYQRVTFNLKEQNIKRWSTIGLAELTRHVKKFNWPKHKKVKLTLTDSMREGMMMQVDKYVYKPYALVSVW